MTLKPRFNLPDITFAMKSAQQIEADFIARYEDELDITMSPADPRRKLVSAIASLIVQERVLIDYGAKQNLISYAEGSYLDHAGMNSDVTRLPATPAKCIVRFTLSISTTQTIPSGTRVTAGDGIFFATTQAVTVTAGQTTVDIDVTCTTAGKAGNGYTVGQLNQLVDPIQWVQSVSNITATSGGADQEDDDAFAERIRTAPETFSVAGSHEAYQFWAKSANSSIVDVSVTSPSAGTVEIRPLLENGTLPSQEILDQVEEKCSDRKIRPLTDNVVVLAPEAIGTSINLTYYIDTADSGNVSSIQSKVAEAISGYKKWQSSKLGLDIAVDELVYRLRLAGVKRAVITSPVYTSVSPTQVVQFPGADTITYGGLE